jgi:hypothetical protein
MQGRCVRPPRNEYRRSRGPGLFGMNAAAVAGGAGLMNLHREAVRAAGMRLWHFCLLSPDRERPLGRPR